MNKATFSALAVLMATGFSVAVDAQAREPGATQQRDRGTTQARERGVNERQHVQRDRVATGVRSGEVTRPEARQLHREARGIERKEQSFRSDGNFSRGERREVQRDLDRHGRNIHQSRNDHDQRGWHGGRDWGHNRGFDHGRHGGREWGQGRGFDRNHGAHNGGRIDGIQQRQQAQIRQGIHDGSLTQQEARRLYGEQRNIASLERTYRADGVLTRDERRDLNGELQDANRHIYNQSHDDDRRFRR